MPIIHIDIIKRGAREKRALCAALTDAVVSSLGVAPETVTIIVHEMDRDQYAVAGVLHADKKTPRGGKKTTAKPVSSQKKTR